MDLSNADARRRALLQKNNSENRRRVVGTTGPAGKGQQHDHHQQQQRSFGRVLQASSSSSIIESKPNPKERLWNPSPCKKPRSTTSPSASSVTVVDPDWVNNNNDENACYAWNQDERRRKRNVIDKENDPNVRPPPSSPPPSEENNNNKNKNNRRPSPEGSRVHHPTSTTIDLNNSFTEKISNLDIGCSTTASSGPPSKQKLATDFSSVLRERHDYFTGVKDIESPYSNEVVKYWHKLEVLHRPSHNYMDKQREISYKMRTILVEWLVEVAGEYSIHNATLHRGVHFVDRFLSRLQISRNNLQLLGTTSLFIACKIEEINPPDTSDLVYITDNTYDKNQILKMECLILSVLDFDLLTPTAHEFTEYYSNLISATPTAKGFSSYVIELTLLYAEKFLKFAPSVIALSACYVASRCCGGSTEEDGFEGRRNNNNRSATSSEMCVPRLLERINTIVVTPELVKSVEEVVGLMFLTVLQVGSSTSPGDSEPANSVCAKYSKFQEKRFLVAAASAAACVSSPWHNSLI